MQLMPPGGAGTVANRSFSARRNRTRMDIAGEAAGRRAREVSEPRFLCGYTGPGPAGAADGDPGRTRAAVCCGTAGRRVSYERIAPT